jgi:dethiobiotin synthetase
MTALVVAGTDTGIGKTVVAAMLTLALDGVYWKPVQAGTRQGTDTATVAALTGLGPERFIPEHYLLTEPLSPHRAAELDGIEIDMHRLALPAETPGHPLLIEGAGGLMVPLTRRTLYLDVFQRWGMPVVLCGRTALGTINHSLLSVEALRTRDIPIVGIVFVGDPQPDSQRTISDFAQVKCLGCLPWLPEMTPNVLAAAFASHFDPEPFRAALGR